MFLHWGLYAIPGRGEWYMSNARIPAEQYERYMQEFTAKAYDPRDWVRRAKRAGMQYVVLTAKHHDGFCLWQSRYTEHCMKNSPYKNGRGDVVREAAEACRRGGIRFGFYLSPWDRNSRYYGADAYNDYYKNQLTELLTGYGDIFCVWFDNACGEGPNGKKQVYDFDGYIELIRKYQPNACIFNDYGPDTRWIGNESGTARYEEWMVVPHELCFRAEKQTEGPLTEGSLNGIYNTWGDLGSQELIRYSRGLAFCPSEVDMSIRPGWFYHPEEEPHSLERLMRTYMTSVGGSALFNLNIPPMPSGRFDPRDVQRLKEFGDALKEAFGQELSVPHTVAREDVSETQCVFRIDFAEETAVNYIALREDISQGQRVERFVIESDGSRLTDGTTVGNLRICPLKGAKTRQLKLWIVAARDHVPSLDIRLY